MKMPHFNRKYPSGAAKKKKKEERKISKVTFMLLITHQKWHF